MYIPSGSCVTEEQFLQLRRIISTLHLDLENVRSSICCKGLFRMVAGSQRGEVGVLLPADDGIEVYGVVLQSLTFSLDTSSSPFSLIRRNSCPLVQHLELNMTVLAPCSTVSV